MDYNSNTYCRAVEKLKDSSGNTIGYKLLNDNMMLTELENKQIKQMMANGEIFPYNLSITKDNKLIHQHYLDHVGLSVPLGEFFNRTLGEFWKLSTLENDLVVCEQLRTREKVVMQLISQDSNDLQHAFIIKAQVYVDMFKKEERYASLVDKLSTNIPCMKIIRADREVDQRLINYLEQIAKDARWKELARATAERLNDIVYSDNKANYINKLLQQSETDGTKPEDTGIYRVREHAGMGQLNEINSGHRGSVSQLFSMFKRKKVR